MVLTDRYFVSSVAYQGARGLDAETILADSEREFPIPDLVIVVDVTPEEGLARVDARGDEAEPVFAEIELQREVARQLARIERPYLVVVDGRGTPDEVHARVVATCEKLFDAGP